MSNFRAAAGRTMFASPTVYDALAVDSGEDTEDEQILLSDTVQEDAESLQHTEVPAKPSKSAIKKASRLARIELKRQQKAKLVAATVQEHQVSKPTPELLQAKAENAPALVVTDSSGIPIDTIPQPKPADLSPPSAKQNGFAHKHKSSTERTSPVSVKLNTAPQETKPPPATHEGKELQKEGAIISETNPPPSIYEHEAPRRERVETALTYLPLTATQQDAEKSKKLQNALTRTLWTFIMIGGFLALLLLGHSYMILLVMLCQTLVYREVTALFSIKLATAGEKQPVQGKDPWSKTLNWYFFAVTNYFLYGESIIYYFKHVVFADAQLLPFVTNHRMISFTLYTIGFVGFVMSLKKGYLKQQFGLFCWVHMSLLLIVVSSHFIMNNILEGLIWFWVPASLVICNDVFAYICGVTFGRTPLIKLSPKKTVEGFVGAFLATLVFALLWGTYFMRFNYMICPVHELGVHAWSSMECTPNPIFIWCNWKIWSPLATVLSTVLGSKATTIPYAPYQLHLLLLACFASLVAPFGGFFASGFKRAFNIKDFGHSIPGHGGMTDRMDCQFLMGVFTYVYYTSLIREHHVTVGGILQTIVSGLSVEEQLELLSDLRRYLESQGIQVS